MPLQRKLDDDELTLLEAIEDEVWLGEFLRTTADGEIDESLWPAKPWYYRDYQRQLLTDKTEHIVLTGGRAIGKCQPITARVYTTEGYKKISDLLKRPSFTVYALTPQMQLVQRRAIAVFDTRCPAHTLITNTGHKIVGTKNHPVLTPEGFRLIEDIKPGDYVAVTTWLPHESQNKSLRWHELRWLGYYLPMMHTHSFVTLETPLKPRFKKIDAELVLMSKQFLTNWRKDEYGNFWFVRKHGPFKHPINSLMKELGINLHPGDNLSRLPETLMSECLEHNQVFIEAAFAQHGTLSTKKVALTVYHEQVALDYQELLLRFGIETRIIKNDIDWTVELYDQRAVYRFWQKFKLPGISTPNLDVPDFSHDPTDFMRYDIVKSNDQTHNFLRTYAVYVYEHNNYISDNIFVHNSVVLQDKIIHEIVNHDDTFPETKESLLVTPNQAQMGPILNEVIQRFTGGKLLKDYLKNNVNKSEGTLTFPVRGKPVIFRFRIAGSTGERNMVGLHLPRIKGDECQLFPMNAYSQLMPAYNGWEKKRQQFWAGVPNGLRNTVLYMVDQKSDKYKKYRIPSHNNPYYSKNNNIEEIKRFGGEQSDGYQQMVLGRHGSAAFQVIPRDSIITETFEFTSKLYASGHKYKGQTYADVLTRPKLPDYLTSLVMAIDPGFVDSCIIQIMGRDKKGIWRTYIRYRLNRIDFKEQEKIIHWLAQHYNIQNIAIDIGAGGGGSGIMHSLIHGDEYKNKNYESKIRSIQFSEHIIAGYNELGEELKQDAKSFAANELAKFVQEGQLVFSEIDQEGISQMERVAKQKSMNGRDQYFVMSDKGGKDNDDHIFASYICFMMAIREEVIYQARRKLGKPKGAFTK